MTSETLSFRPAWAFLFLYQILPSACFCFVGYKIFYGPNASFHFDPANHMGLILLVGLVFGLQILVIVSEAVERIEINQNEIRLKGFLSRKSIIYLSEVSSIKIYENFLSRGERRILIKTINNKSYKFGSNLFYLKEIIGHIKELRPDIAIEA